MSPEDQHTQMLDPSRSQSPKSPQTTPSAPAQTRANLSDGLAVKLEQLRAFYGDVEQVKGIDLEFHANEVTAIIGPSGCGKSTMVRCINRMHEEIPGAHAEGSGAARRLGRLRPRRRRRRGPPGDRHGLPEAEPVPDDVDLRQRGGRPAAHRHAAARPARAGSSARCAARGCGTRSRTASHEPGAGLSGRPAAAPVHRALARRRTRGPADGRALLGARPDRDAEDRGADRRAQAARHDRDRHPQHAAGRARRRPHRLHARRRARRGRPDPGDLHQARTTRGPRNMSPASSATAGTSRHAGRPTRAARAGAGARTSRSSCSSSRPTRWAAST